MKKIFITALTFCSFALTNAQNVSFGVKAGANFTTIKVEDGDNLDYKTGFHIGGLAHIHMDRKFALQPELTYSTHGAKADGNSDIKLKLNYLNIPILLQYMFSEGFRVETGPQFGILTSAKQDLGSTEIDVKDSYKTLDLSIPLGLSYVTPSGFGVDARWLFGLSDIDKDDNDDTKIKNSGAQLGVFYLFGAHRSKKK